jgi:uncharacterized membrane protein YcaP (DUF421 family)
LIENGRVNELEMRRALLSEADLLETQRIRNGTASLEDVRVALLERDGQISLLRGH